LDGPASAAAWDAAAEANWRRIGDDEHEALLDLVRERLPELARHRRWLEGLAKGWAYDPSMVAGMPPPADRPGRFKRSVKHVLCK
jgi:hypothetical protein